MKKIAIIIAGGSGKRMGQDIPKQFLNVGEKPVIIYTLEAFQNHPMIDAIIVVCIDGWQTVLESYAKQFDITKLVSIVKGGSCGQASIKHGLDEAKRLFDDDDIVLIHDAIRPMVSSDLISDNIAKCEKYGNATAVAPCTTVVLNKTAESYSESVTDRDMIVLTQTPQAFVLNDILSAHEEAKKKGITDSVASCALYTQLGRKVYFSAGDETNIKLTRPGDIQIFKALLSVQKSKWMK
ncbi:2-C-methyl-D-erythritol 4-phosphate cytidylyltransferase [Candidatus Saccharibacteria bacterium]|nr:2-C-methyl-D-erythritol 4-phosphate cytidylyltransferase [Candidatus Saccharibacteria bacterium]